MADYSLEQELYESEAALEEYKKTHGMAMSCYRKCMVNDNEALSILSELAIPPKNGGSLILFPTK